MTGVTSPFLSVAPPGSRPRRGAGPQVSGDRVELTGSLPEVSKEPPARRGSVVATAVLVGLGLFSALSGTAAAAGPLAPAAVSQQGQLQTLEPLSPGQQSQMESLAKFSPGESGPAQVVRGHYAEAVRTVVSHSEASISAREHLMEVGDHLEELAGKLPQGGTLTVDGKTVGVTRHDGQVVVIEQGPDGSLAQSVRTQASLQVLERDATGHTSSLVLTPHLVRVSTDGLTRTQDLSTGSFAISGPGESWNLQGLSISHQTVEESPMEGMRTTNQTRFEVPPEARINPRTLTESRTTRVDDLQGGGHTSVSSRVEIRPDGTLRTHWVFPDGDNAGSGITF